MHFEAMPCPLLFSTRGAWAVYARARARATGCGAHASSALDATCTRVRARKTARAHLSQWSARLSSHPVISCRCAPQQLYSARAFSGAAYRKRLVCSVFHPCVHIKIDPLALPFTYPRAGSASTSAMCAAPKCRCSTTTSAWRTILEGRRISATQKSETGWQCWSDHWALLVVACLWVAAAAAVVVAGHLVEVATAEAVEGAVQVPDLEVGGVQASDTADEGDTMVTVIRHSTAHRQACTTVAAGVLLAVAEGISTVTVTVTATATVTAIGTAIGTATGGVAAAAAAAVSTKGTAAVAAVIGGDTLTGA